MRSSKGGAQVIMPISRRQLLAAIPAGLMAVHAANAAEISL